MTIHPKTQVLARRLLDYEATAAHPSGASEPVTLQVYEKLRLSLSQFAGNAAFASLAMRALVLAKPEAPRLESAQISPDGTLRGLGELEAQIETNKNQERKQLTDESGVILIARLLGLLHVFLGEALMLSLLRVTWPIEIFDDRNSGNGRNT